MVTTTDHNEVRLTGENSFMRLHLAPGEEAATFLSHWRVLLSPAGPGHALFFRSELTGGEIRIYADNVALARWLQRDIEKTMHPDFADESSVVTEATFSRYGDTRSYWTEEVKSTDTELLLTWYDFIEPFVIHVEPYGKPEQPHGVYSLLIPARGARIVLNGRFAQGKPIAREQDGQPTSSCCVALSETWVRPH